MSEVAGEVSAALYREISEIGRTLHGELADRSKDVRLEIYEHGYHDFVLGPQGQERRDLPQGEILLQGALDALERSVDFVKTGQL